MKKVLFFLLLLLVPFIVKAEVTITNVEIENKTPGLEVEENPSFEGLKLNLNLKFEDLNDYIQYKVTIKNDTKKDYEIQSGESLKSDEYIKYTVESDNQVLKAGKEQIIYIKASYVKEVPITAFTNGKYIEKKDTAITLVNNEKDTNPNTAIGYFILPVAVIMFIALLVTLINKRKLDRLSPFIIALAVALPFSIMAIEKLTVEVEANIEIETPEREFAYMYACLGEDHDIDGIASIKHKKGMAWNEFLASDYYNNLDTIYKPTLERIDRIEYLENGNTCIQGEDIDYACFNNLERINISINQKIKPNNEGIYYYSACK